MPTSDPLDPVALRRRAQELRDKATELIMEADLYERTAAAREALPRKSMSTSTRATPYIPPAANEARKAKISRRIGTHAEHPFVRAVLTRYPSVKAWAAERGYPYQAVHSWYTTKTGKRSIPRDAAEAIEKEFGPDACPATLETWFNGIQGLRGPGR